MLKVLKISVVGLPFYKDKCEINFLKTQRVTENSADEMCQFPIPSADNLYTNNMIGLFGINASGKTTMLRLLTFVFHMLNNVRINDIRYKSLLGEGNDNNEITFEVVFVDEKTVNLLHTDIKYEDEHYTIAYEYIKSRKLLASDDNSSIFDFSSAKIIFQRDPDEKYLLDDMSIMVGYNKRNNVSFFFADMLETSSNKLMNLKDYPLSVISYLDPRVEYINTRECNGNSLFYLKVRGEKERILYDPAEFNDYLSAGTIKGINLFVNAMSALEKGGYLIVDDLESHLNQEIVQTLINLFKNNNVNRHGATLAFSSHWSELLDIIEHNDCIYIVENKDKITATPLDATMKIGDNNKAISFRSGYIGNTAPSYEAYIKLKRDIINNL